MGEWGLHQLGEVGLVAGRPGGAASTDSGFSSSCKHVATKAQAEPPQTLAGQLPLGQLGLGSGPLGLRVKYTSVVMMVLTFGQLHFVIP
jgi:hypothetical protein